MFEDEIIINKLFSEGESILELMRNEVVKCPSTVQSEMNGRMYAVTNEWNAFKTNARRPQHNGFSGSASSSSFGIPTTTSRLNQGIEALERTSQSVLRAEIAARESEEIGTAVISELAGQRETLLKTRDRIDVANHDLKKSHRIIRLINSQVVTNKCLLYVIILLEMCILVSIVYMRFLHKHSK